MAKDKEQTPEAPRYKFRYVCHGCTNTALFSTTLMQDIEITCEHCGLQQQTVPANWVVL